MYEKSRLSVLKIWLSCTVLFLYGSRNYDDLKFSSNWKILFKIIIKNEKR